MNFFRLLFTYFLPLLFSPRPFRVTFGKNTLLVNPRTLDLFVVAETFLDQVYEPSFKLGKVQTIVDLGAHIGDSVMWLYTRFNPKLIISVEMESDTFNLLRKNIELNHLKKKVLPLHNAVYSHDDEYVSYRKSTFFSIANFITPQLGNRKVKTISLKKIMESSDISYIDYLKMDIEGAEKNILTSENADLLKTKVKFIAVECHGIIGLSGAEVKRYLEGLGFEVVFKKTTILNSINELIHAVNRTLEKN